MQDNAHNVNHDQDEALIQRCPHDRENPYSMISNALIRDNRISPECRWLLISLLSNRDGWKISAKQLWLANKDWLGRDKIMKLINEGIQAGYIKRKNNYKNNLVCGVSYFLSEHAKFKPEETDPAPGQCQDKNNEVSNNSSDDLNPGAPEFGDPKTREYKKEQPNNKQSQRSNSKEEFAAAFLSDKKEGLSEDDQIQKILDDRAVAIKFHVCSDPEKPTEAENNRIINYVLDDMDSYKKLKELGFEFKSIEQYFLKFPPWAIRDAIALYEKRLPSCNNKGGWLYSCIVNKWYEVYLNHDEWLKDLCKNCKSKDFKSKNGDYFVYMKCFDDHILLESASMAASKSHKLKYSDPEFKEKMLSIIMPNGTPLVGADYFIDAFAQANINKPE